MFGPTSLIINNECGGEDEQDPGLRSWFRCVRKKSGDSVLDDIMDLKLKYQGCSLDLDLEGIRKDEKEKNEIFLGKVS